jgi:hypothetical protein
MRILTTALVTLVLSGYASTAAAEDARYLSIKSLGEVNGVALKCKYLDQVQRIKQSIIATVPKERVYGLAFDHSSNDAFLAFIESREPCPGPAGFNRQVDERIEEMKAAFATQPGESQ